MEKKQKSRSDILASLSLVEYQVTFQRKSSLEQKSSSYVTVLSILLAVATAIYFSQLIRIPNKCIKIILALSYVIEAISSIFAMMCHLFLQKTTKLFYFDLNNVDPIWDEEDDKKIGSVYQSAKFYISENNLKIKKIEIYIDLMYNFTWFSLIAFIIFMVISIILSIL